MARLTKTDIEQRILSGNPVTWKEPNGKESTIQLTEAKERRLFEFLLKSSVREPKGLPSDFTNGLVAAFSASNDPAQAAGPQTTTGTVNGPWKIASINVEGFGGVNAWNGKPFPLALDSESLLIEGPNGSGKSSLTAAIVWALTGERPRDQDDKPPEEARSVYSIGDTQIGTWAPLATYPSNAADLKSPASVSVEIAFSDAQGNPAVAKRTFDGQDVKAHFDPDLEIPQILLEAGLLMPARLPHLRLDSGRSRLTDAVQKLTGLDDLKEIGELVQGLCHGGREYLTFYAKTLATSEQQFNRYVEQARTTLSPVGLAVPSFVPQHTDEDTSKMAILKQDLESKATHLTKVVSSDLADGLDFTDPQVQKQISFEVESAKKDVESGLSSLPTWTTLHVLLTSLDLARRTELRQAIAASGKALEKALDFHEKEIADNRFRLKAVAAQWHTMHGGEGDVSDCPVCTQSLSIFPDLRSELNELRDAGEAATRKLTDNLNAIISELEAAVPQPLRKYLSEPLTTTPKADILSDIETKFVTDARYQNYLVGCAKLVKAACLGAPSDELSSLPTKSADSPEASALLEKLTNAEIFCALADWYEASHAQWTAWWSAAAGDSENSEGFLSSGDTETFLRHLERLSNALSDAEPYRLAAEAIGKAWEEGKTASKLAKEQGLRSNIAVAMSPLKTLGNLAEAQARTAIDELSERISRIHQEIYIADNLRFHKTELQKRAGLIVRGQLSDQVHIDATLVANTSWLRGVLWAFIFALREEAVEQLGIDVLPLMILDDPQQTFDSEHRHRWAEQIAKLQKSNPGVQVILTTHDEQFLTFLEYDGVTGRHTLLCSAGPELGHIGIFEGNALVRKWDAVQTLKTPAAAREYMAEVRVFAEGMLKLILRGEDVIILGSVIGSSRAKLLDLYKADHEPWRNSAFKKLAGALSNSVPAIKFIETAHHSSASQMGMSEAADVEEHWRRNLHPALERAFRIARDHRALHGGLTALHAMEPSVVLPDGHKSAVSTLSLPLIGTAAALTDGRVADGCFDLSIVSAPAEVFALKDHVVFRVSEPTLEPVARPCDLLLVSEHAQVTPKSLVVAMSEDRLLARRLEIADNHSDVAVLTAHAINPRLIAPPVVAKLSTLTMRKIVGVVFDHGKTALGIARGMEICDCGGDSIVKAAFAGLQGLVEIDGHSAEPQALDKQFLLIGNPVSLGEAEKQLIGHPVIAEDSDGARYFKRYRVDSHVVILESLEIGGDFPPVVLLRNAGESPYLTTLWPVLGVLFDRP